MASQNHRSFIFLIIIMLVFPFPTYSSISSSPFQENNPLPFFIHPSLPPRSEFEPELPQAPSDSANIPPSSSSGPINPGGLWILLQKSIGISAMHMQLLYNNKVVIFDRTDFGRSNISLPFGRCRFSVDDKLRIDCTAHSVIYDIVTNTFRPLMVQTDVWCSSAAVNPDGVLVQTGGYRGGADKIRLFTPCNNDFCDWLELPQNLTVRRWYASDQILPDGRIIIVGGRRAFSYEFFPKNSVFFSNAEVYWLQFLKETSDPREENNLYPFLHLLPDGNLFVFANQHSVILDYVNNKILRKFPPIPGEKRSYPSTGSSVLLPLRLTGSGSRLGSPSPEVEVMICGGANGGSYIQARLGVYVAASKSCGRLRVTDPDPEWEMETMPMNRVMPDMLLLPTGDVLILNGASKGSAGWELADDPVLHPVLYRPSEMDPQQRFTVLNPTVNPRLYHSSAVLLPDGRVLVGGSNPHALYRFTGVKYPTDLTLEAFLPPYLGPQYSQLRPSILTFEGPTDNIISYGQQFSITFTLGLHPPGQDFRVTMIAPSFTTHSFAMNQRLVMLDVVGYQQLSAFAFKVTVCAPPTRNIAPPGYYMTFVVNGGIPSTGVWIRMK
ncbi:aldehyde oxidase GLOX-like [Coffea arabica]|uniref:Aldehyde oxidase GLOX-like n=1 Tax=Coffea arabica TaxID=13443 RepID=A0A6P6V7A9_COFAR